MSKYAGILKAVTDLLDKPFSYGNKFEVKTKASNGVTFTSDAAVSGKASANLKLEYKHGNVSVDKLSVGTDKKIVGEFTFTEAVKSTDVLFKFTDGHRADAKDINASFGAVIKGGDAGTHTVDVDVLSGPNITAASLFQYKGFLLGATASLNTTLLHDSGSGAPVTLAGVGALAGVQKGDLTAAVASTDFFSGAVGTVVHKASDTITYGALLKFPVTSDKPVALKFGGSYKLDADATVHGTVDHEAKVSLAYKQKLNSFATLAVSGQVDASDLGGDKHKFGLTLSLSS